MPPRKIDVAIPAPAPVLQLPELSYSYLMDRSQWIDFKRALNNCGVTWSLPDWRTTIVYLGDDYKLVKKEMGPDLDAIFQLQRSCNEEKRLKVMETSKKKKRHSVSHHVLPITCKQALDIATSISSSSNMTRGFLLARSSGHGW